MDVATATSGPVSLAKKRVAVLGVGKMGGIILRALLEQGLLAPERTCATVHQADLANARARNPKISIGTDNRQAVSGANVVLDLRETTADQASSGRFARGGHSRAGVHFDRRVGADQLHRGSPWG